MSGSTNTMETLILGVIVGFVPSLLILAMTSDAKARAECLITTYNIKNLLTALDNNLIGDDTKHTLISSIKNVLEKLAVEKGGLLFSYDPMNRLISKSLSLIRQMDNDNDNLAFHTKQTGNSLLMLFDEKHSIQSEFSKFDICQKFLSKSFPARFFIWIGYLPTRLKNSFRNTKICLVKKNLNSILQI